MSADRLKSIEFEKQKTPNLLLALRLFPLAKNVKFAKINLQPSVLDSLDKDAYIAACNASRIAPFTELRLRFRHDEEIDAQYETTPASADNRKLATDQRALSMIYGSKPSQIEVELDEGQLPTFNNFLSFFLEDAKFSVTHASLALTTYRVRDNGAGGVIGGDYMSAGIKMFDKKIDGFNLEELDEIQQDKLNVWFKDLEQVKI